MQLSEETLALAARELASRDQELAAIFDQLGAPPLWAREPGFATLIHIILEQQVSLASARAAFERLRQMAAPLTPASLLELDDATLKQIGFSRQKTHYARLLALALVEGRLDLDGLAALGDAEVQAVLMRQKGLGRWSAEIYLLMALRRPDIWPSGDLALAVAAQQVKQLPRRPTPAELEALAEPWRPWRAVAARLLWHHYLSRRGKRSPGS